MTATSFATKGSQLWLQVAVNRAPVSINGPLLEALKRPDTTSIDWLSPLEHEGFLEYQDQPFIDRFTLPALKRPLSDFWPASGARWDGLAKASSGELLLVEAKANIKELVTSATGATGAGLGKIRASLEEVRKAVAPKATQVEWSGTSTSRRIVWPTCTSSESKMG